MLVVPPPRVGLLAHESGGPVRRCELRVERLHLALELKRGRTKAKQKRL
jgi:hypothetical protein